jgi:phosphate transport system substrate-binding protein
VYFYVRRLPAQAVDPLAKEYLRLVLSREGRPSSPRKRRGYLP